LAGAKRLYFEEILMQERKLLHDRRSGHALVGLFVITACIFFIWLLLFQKEDRAHYQLSAEFNTISNLSEATQVKLRGFTIGQVESVQFRPSPGEGQAYFLVALGIEEVYQVPEGTIAEIRSSGLVGDTFINLDVSQAGKKPLAPGSRVRGRDEVGVKELVSSITEMAHKLGGAGESIRRADLGYRLGRLGDSMHRVAGSLELVAHSTDSLLVTSRLLVDRTGPRAESVLVQLQENLVQMNRAMRQTDTLVTGSRDDVHNSLKALRSAVERLDAVLGRVDSMVAHKEGQIDSTLGNLHSASESVRDITAHPWKLLTGQGKKDGEKSE
jgi:phospholipid/cholesterol/gamma-HCH transport system substrate-binding protein